MPARITEAEVPYTEVGCKECKWTSVGNPKIAGQFGHMKAAHAHAARNRGHRAFLRTVRTTIFILRGE